MRVSTGSEVASAPSMEQSAIISGRDRGRGSGRDFGGRGFIRGGRGSYESRERASEKDHRQCRHCGCNNHISEKCWEKFGRPEWAQLSDSSSPPSCGTQSSSSAIPNSSTVVLSQEEYDRL